MARGLHHTVVRTLTYSRGVNEMDRDKMVRLLKLLEEYNDLYPEIGTEHIPWVLIDIYDRVIA